MLKSHLGFVRADSLHAAPVFQMLMIGALALGVGMGGHRLKTHATALTAQAVPAVQDAVSAVAQSAPAQALANAGEQLASAANPPENVLREAEIDDGQDFADMLGDAGVSDADAAAASAALARVYPLNNLRAGQDVSLNFSRTTQSETFNGAVFQPEDTKEITISRAAGGQFSATVKMIPIIRERVAAHGEIRSSLYEAGQRAGVPHAIMAAMIHVYAHDIDFQRDIHPGDSFEVLYDQPKTAQGKAVGEGSIIYAAMHIGNEIKPIYRVTFADRTVDYFDAAGHSARRALLRTPVSAAHITSGFGMRMHPILGYSKMHKGVDFGAPVGTPIFAAGAGVIEQIGMVNGFGRYIKIKHNNGLETIYGHMSRFNTKLYRGSHVNQGEVIAYVGMSGRATGPHLHFEVHKDGVAVNPLSVKMPTGRVLQGLQLAQFKKGQEHIRQEYSSLLGKAEGPTKVSSTSTVPPAATPAKSL
ncbi:MAG: M23 family metallopeptidase [Alphaproteobacteria bacterium]|nr:M23 family metallopeptidase [Alphaproteobacteria bacterium]